MILCCDNISIQLNFRGETSMERSDVKTIIKAKALTKIPYMENPPAKGGEIKYLTLDGFKEKFNCEYTEGIVVKDAKKRPSAIEADFKDSRAKAAYERMLNPLDSLVICKMSDKMGHGLFTTKDISVGTVICLYAGEYNPDSTEIAYSCEDIDAAKYGGFARFMQHQPISKEGHLHYLMQCLKDSSLLAIHENITQEQAESLLTDSKFVAQKTQAYKKEVEKNHIWGEYNFSKIKFNKNTLANEIAQSNVFYENTEVAGVQVITMIAMRDIKANESIGFSYGSMYWRHPSFKNSPVLFTKFGDVIPSNNHYKVESTTLFSDTNNSSSDDSSDEENYFSNNKKYTNAYSNPHDLLSHAMNLMKYAPIPDKKDRSTHLFSSQNQTISEFAMTEKKQGELLESTESFFKAPVDAEWKKYPDNGLKGKYVGHQVRFFTMPLDRAEEAKKFTQQLKNAGFDAELKTANKKPSVVVDLTASKLDIK